MAAQASSRQSASCRDAGAVSYHHFALDFAGAEVPAKLAGVRYVLVAGCPHRVRALAEHLSANLSRQGTAADQQPQPLALQRLTRDRSRFDLYLVGGGTLVASHGMGPASLSIALHELLLMCQVAQVLARVTVVRLGTCGGIGVEPGTVCVTDRALDPLLQDFVELKICGKLVQRPAIVHLETALAFERAAKRQAASEQQQQEAAPATNTTGAPAEGSFAVRRGATVATNDFYEEQGRTNGAICDHSDADRQRFLERLAAAGVINMEMESNQVAAMCYKLRVPAAVVCVALNNRLRGDQMHLSAAQMARFELRLFKTITRFIQEHR